MTELTPHRIAGSVFEKHGTKELLAKRMLRLGTRTTTAKRESKHEPMINQQTLQGNWKEIQGKLKSKWGSLTDDDVMEFDGNVEQLMGRLQKKTGAGRESIEQFFDQFAANGASAVTRAGEAVRGYAQQATEAVQETSQHALDTVREGYAGVEGMVRQSPAQSMAYCFGAGVLMGVAINLFFRWR